MNKSGSSSRRSSPATVLAAYLTSIFVVPTLDSKPLSLFLRFTRPVSERAKGKPSARLTRGGEGEVGGGRGWPDAWFPPGTGRRIVRGKAPLDSTRSGGCVVRRAQSACRPGWSIGGRVRHLSAPFLSLLHALTIGSRLYSESSSPQRKNQSPCHMRFGSFRITIWTEASLSGGRSEHRSLSECVAPDFCCLYRAVLGTRTDWHSACQ
jgi:hypothetical protein